MLFQYGPFLRKLSGVVRRAESCAQGSLKHASVSLGMGARDCAHAQTGFDVLSLVYALFFKILACCVLLGLGATSAQAVTAAGVPITNVASASYTLSGTTVTVTGSVTLVTSVKTPAAIDFLSYVGGTSGVPDTLINQYKVSTTQCNKSGGGYVPLAAPTPPGQSTLVLSGVQALASSSLYASGDVVFVRVTDYDQNVNPNVMETLDVTLTASGGDSEQLRLTETGPSTGVFVGYIPSASGAATAGDCVFNIGGNQKLVATYIDQSESSVAITAAALVDPLGVVFDSTTGNPIDGAEVTLIDVSTGNPALVHGNDGKSIYPSKVVTGSTMVDSGGTRYVMGSGRFQFPRINPGDYKLQVAVPVGHSAPSKVSADDIRKRFGTDTFVITAGSYSDKFTVLPGPALVIDIPVDPSSASNTSVTIKKTAGKSEVSAGDFLPYTLNIRNNNTYALTSVHVKDRLPPGFRYQKGSARIGDVQIADPTIGSDGRDLDFTVGTLPSSTDVKPEVVLNYVVAVVAGVPLGQANNTAWVAGNVTSNTAQASVLVKDDLNRERVILAGRVTLVESCRDDEKDSKTTPPQPLANIRVMLEDGTYVVTDKEGRWHIDNLRAGTHVVQLDETSMPQESLYEACEQNTRTGGRNFSQFVNVRPGSLWRADFRYMRVASCMRQKIHVQDRAVSVELEAPVSNQGMSVVVGWPAGLKVLPHSVLLDGKPAQVDLNEGYMVLRLGRHPKQWSHQLTWEFDAAPSDKLKLAVQVQPVNQPTQRMPGMVWTPGQADVQQCSPIELPSAAVAAAAAKNEADSKAAAQAQTLAAQLQLIEQLPYDEKWVAAADPGVEWLHPQLGFSPALPLVKVAVKHGPKDKVLLSVNGAPVNPMRYEGTVSNPAGTVALSNWRSVDLKDGTNLLELTVQDPDGKVLLQERREIHYIVAPAKVSYDSTKSQLAADGRTAPVIALRMLDKNDKPVRRGAGGDVSINAPYQAYSQKESLQNEPLTGNLGGKAHYEIGEDGIALIRLQPTTQAGEVVLNFDFGEAKTREVRVWLTPDLREWVLVGFAQGTVGHKSLSGNVESLGGTSVEHELFDQNRIAFYAKGQIKGEYLLTAAYDTAKERGSAGSTVALRQAVDPTKYYTLYADSTQAQYDAASVSKLYVKIEKAQYYAMFGDYDTGMSVTELGRYSRTLNGAKTEYKGDTTSYVGFASMTTQSYGKKEIQGQDISGLYRLGQGNIVVNTDKVRVETRDRLHPEKIIQTQDYARYVDYQIDYTDGTLFFREPIPAYDANLNPVYIVAEYESDSKGEAKLTYGGRVATKLDSKTEVGVSHVHEGNAGREANLTGVDTTVNFNETTKLHAEVARSQRHGVDDSSSGGAYIVELTQNETDHSLKAYARKQDMGFGLGQQSTSATGTQKMGVEGQVKLNEDMTLQGTLSREQKETTESTADRTLAEAKLQWGKIGVGLRAINESDTTGQSSESRQLVATASREMLDQQLTLRASAEIDLSSRSTTLDATGTSLTSSSTGVSAFPNRLQVGADYRLTTQTTLFATQNLSWNDESRYTSTRMGMRMQPWMGAMVTSAVGTQNALDSGRLYADLGLVQKLKIDEEWSADFGINRMQTLRGAAPAAASLDSGTITGSGSGSASSSDSENGSMDYTSLYAGLAYKDTIWGGSGRIEWRNGQLSDKFNILLSAERKLDDGRVLGGGLTISTVNASESRSRKFDARLSYAYRPLDVLNQDWMWLDRLEYADDVEKSTSSHSTTRKLINNFNANWQPNRRTQVAFQYGAKYVFSTIDGAGYKGYTDLMGVESRYDLSRCWDVGLSASILHTWLNSSKQYQFGVSTGYKVADNMWFVLGYNQAGFKDPDFSGAGYRAKGLYISLRAKFDQDTFGLNKRRDDMRAVQY